MADEKKKPDLSSILGYDAPNSQDIKKKLVEYTNWEISNQQKLIHEGSDLLQESYNLLKDGKKGLLRHGDIDKTTIESHLNDIYVDLGSALEEYLKKVHEKSGSQEAYGTFKKHFEEAKKKGQKEYFETVLHEFEVLHGSDGRSSKIKRALENLLKKKGSTTGELLNMVRQLMQNDYVESYVMTTSQRKMQQMLGKYHHLHVLDVAKKEFVEKYNGKVHNHKAWVESGIYGAIEATKYATYSDDKKHLARPENVGLSYTIPKPAPKK